MRLHRTALLTAAIVAALAVAPWASSESTPATDQAVQAVQQQVAYIQTYLAAHQKTMPVGYLTAAAANDYVVGHVSAPEYGYLSAIQKSGAPDATAEQILATQAGLCGSATIAFRQIMGQLGYQTRQVNFLAPGGGHVSAEVMYDGGWHWYDPTFGVYYRDHGTVLPIQTVRKLKDPARFAVTDQTLLWRQIAAATGTATVTGMALPLSHAPIQYQP